MNKLILLIFLLSFKFWTMCNYKVYITNLTDELIGFDLDRGNAIDHKACHGAWGRVSSGGFWSDEYGENCPGFTITIYRYPSPGKEEVAIDHEYFALDAVVGKNLYFTFMKDPCNKSYIRDYYKN